MFTWQLEILVTALIDYLNTHQPYLSISQSCNGNTPFIRPLPPLATHLKQNTHYNNYNTNNNNNNIFVTHCKARRCTSRALQLKNALFSLQETNALLCLIKNNIHVHYRTGTSPLEHLYPRDTFIQGTLPLVLRVSLEVVPL